MYTNFFSVLLSLNILALATAATLYAESLPSRDFFQDLAHISQGSPIETSRAHGLEGYNVGLGINSSVIESDIGKDKFVRRGANSNVSPRVFITKGLFYPIDLGINFSTVMNNSNQGTSVSGYLQWTVFERFTWPALAVRTLYTQLHGVDNVSFETMGVEGLLSYGFSIASIYGGYGENVHDASYKVEDGGDASLLSLIYVEGQTIRDKFRERNMFFGAQFMIYPPFTSFSAEWRKPGTQGQSILAKLSHGI